MKIHDPTAGFVLFIEKGFGKRSIWIPLSSIEYAFQNRMKVSGPILKKI